MRRRDTCRELKELRGEGEVLIPTLPCCYLAPSLWTGLIWAGLCCLAGAGRPRTTCLKSGRRKGRKRKGWKGRSMEEYKKEIKGKQTEKNKSEGQNA